MWVLGCKGESGFSAKSTAEEVTAEIDGTGLTAIVTGASSGIGVETTRVLALRGVHVVMAVRNLDAGRKVRDTIVKEVSNAKFDVKELDLSSLASVRKFALEYKTLGFPLNIRIFSNPSRRIINVSSMGHQLVSRGGIQFDKINDDTRFKYGQSKLANILHANELARRLKEVGVNITVNSLHPGEVITNIVRQKSFLYGILEGIFKHLLKNVQQGAATTCYLALHPRVKGVSGEYFQDNNRAKASSLARDAKLAEKLWDFSLNLNASKS